MKVCPYLLDRKKAECSGWLINPVKWLRKTWPILWPTSEMVQQTKEKEFGLENWNGARVQSMSALFRAQWRCHNNSKLSNSEIKTSHHSNIVFPLVTWPPHFSTCANTSSAYFKHVKTHTPLECANKLEQRCFHLVSCKDQQKAGRIKMRHDYILTRHESLNYCGLDRHITSDSE